MRNSMFAFIVTGLAAVFAQRCLAVPMMTPWGEKVTSGNAWRGHPRPQMERAGWTCLNGDWDYQITSITNASGRPTDWIGKIRVPFALEAPLSGCGGRLLQPHEYLWYSRKLELDPKPGERILLHFGAVDFRSIVYLGHREVALHEGGQLPFTVDLTPFAKRGENTLTVLVWDPTEDFIQPRGKQAFRTSGCFYTRSSGITQTVWLETVPEKHIADYDVMSDIDAGTVTFTFKVDGVKYGDDECGTVEIYSKGTSSVCARQQFRPGEAVTIKMPEGFRLWSPETPNLYDFTAKFGRDAVKGYFAMRKFEKRKDGNGVLRFFLNNKPYFVIGTLDQGWWPDGLLTPPSDEAMAFDIQTLKDCGFNTMRKHIKVEPLRYYALCDRMGILVLQDMPSCGAGSRSPIKWATVKNYALYRNELKGMIDLLRKVPSIVMWVPYNEGWGQHDQNLTHTTLDFVKRYDPTRLVDGPSGWQDFEGGQTTFNGRKLTPHKPQGECEAGDVVDYHYYRGPAMPPVNDRRVSFLGEFGGLGHPVSGHVWREFDQGATLGKKTGDWGYGGIEDTKTRDGLEKTYLDLMQRLGALAMKGLGGSIYTQTTDVEIEINGILTYDRKVLKFNPKVLKAAHEAVIQSAILGTVPRVTKVFAPCLDPDPAAWAWTTEPPASGWEAAGFDDSAWKRSAGGFGNGQIAKDYSHAKVSTEWTTEAIWLRRHFKYAKQSGELLVARFNMFHDEDVEVYLNGVLMVAAKRWNKDWADFAVPGHKFAAAVREGDNVIAVKVVQKNGGQYIDLGLSVDFAAGAACGNPESASISGSGNPIMEGWYADPQIRLYGDTYWVFPTVSARFSEETFLDAFSSKDMKTWKKHSRILSTNEVTWAKGAMWAPDAHEVDGKYYLFFSANDAYPVNLKAGDLTPKKEAKLQGYGGIGVAVADRPEGPYRDLIGRPLIDQFWNRAQPIDQYVFKYKGQWYMVYGGWGRCNLVKLAKDFKSLIPFEDGSMWRDFTPKGYVEGSVIFERKGKWYFMYSCGGWTRDNYCVNYSVADNPFGPFEFKGKVLGVQRPLATGAGHHSVICKPGTDEWYICYHRRPIPSKGPHHRVTCIDRMEFSENGDIKPVVMTK